MFDQTKKLAKPIAKILWRHVLSITVVQDTLRSAFDIQNSRMNILNTFCRPPGTLLCPTPQPSGTPDYDKGQIRAFQTS